MKIVGDASGRKNKKIELYIEGKIKELESNLMYVPNENKKNYLWHL